MNKLLFLALALLPCLAWAQMPTGKEIVPSSNSSFEQKVLSLVNQERKKARKKPLKWDEKLARAARYHAKDMATEGYFDHDTQDKKGNKFVVVCDYDKRLTAFYGEELMTSAENIAYGQSTPEEVMKTWMRSAGHKSNILGKHELLGVGFYRDPKTKTTYWVQTFGTADQDDDKDDDKDDDDDDE